MSSFCAPQKPSRAGRQRRDALFSTVAKVRSAMPARLACRAHEWCKLKTYRARELARRKTDTSGDATQSFHWRPDRPAMRRRIDAIMPRYRSGAEFRAHFSRKCSQSSQPGELCARSKCGANEKWREVDARMSEWSASIESIGGPHASCACPRIAELNMRKT